MLGFDFVNLDDQHYVSENPHVLSGLSPEGFVWAMTSTAHANWHPLTWLSLMLDAEIGGNDPAVYHATNVGLHLANTWLLFLLLSRMSGSVWRSLFVALCFGVHPLHVESVAWITERKDVLSTSFWLLTLLAYVRYTDSPRPGRYLLVCAGFSLGLMAKPMLVSLPLTLLLVDYWPLARLSLRALWEKVPLFFLAAGSSVLTLHAQSTGGSLNSLEALSLGDRVSNALTSYVGYVTHMFWPFGLAAIYPHPGDALPTWRIAVAGLVLLLLSAGALLWARRAPYLAVGWLWYLITLLPVIGLVQVGIQAMADRYTYVPLIGLFVVLAWGIPDLLRHAGAGPMHRPLAAAAIVVTLLLSIRAWDQTRHWKTGVDLFEHTVRVTRNNARARNGLGMALTAAQRRSEAIPHFREAIRIEPGYADPYANLAGVLALEGQQQEALRWFDRALRLNPRDDACLANFGTLLMRLGRTEESADAFSRAIEIEPDNGSAHKNLGVILARRGELDRAVEHFSEALRIDPTDEGARRNLERARAERQH